LSSNHDPKGFTTKRVHADRLINRPQHGAVHEPITKSVLFDFDNAQDLIDVFQGKKMGHVYSRSSTGSANALQNMLNDLEDGAGAVCFSTGMAAISSALLALLKQGDHLIVSQFLFGNTSSFFSTLSRFGIELTYVDVTDAKQVERACKENTRGVFCETIANPVTQVADITGIAALCADKGILFMLDTTMTPAPLFNAKEHGVSLLFTSLTKYIGGHGNALGGAVVDCGNYDWQQFPHILPLYQVADQTQWGLTQIRKRGLRDMGATLAPEAAHTLAVGMETLALRVTKMCDNAAQLARFLHGHEKVSAVYYPGLAHHPQHSRSNTLFKQSGGILSVELKEGMDPVAFLNTLNLVLCATHLGDNRTLALPVASTIFFENSVQERAEMGVSDTMIRISVGIEDIEDLIADFEQGLTQL